ncbi:MAG: TIGR04282 family arsenosugar biosynthesis glycosyltransferase [Desulfobacterales bacterium]
MQKISLKKTGNAKNKNRRCVLVFVREPEMGKVKTRLAKSVGNDVALKLYMSFVEDELDMLRGLSCDVIVCYCPESGERQVRDWLKNENHFMAQVGKDLGRRMAAAFESAFGLGYHQALLVGSDIPDLSSSIISEAFKSLNKHQVCIGPSHDGGYYLIGFNRNACFKSVFEAIPWGTSHVFEKTVQCLRENKIGYHLLSSLKDMDRVEDLVWLKRSLEKDHSTAKRTLQCLKDVF